MAVVAKSQSRFHRGAAAPAEAEEGKTSTADEGSDQAKSKSNAPPAKVKKEESK